MLPDNHAKLKKCQEGLAQHGLISRGVFKQTHTDGWPNFEAARSEMQRCSSGNLPCAAESPPAAGSAGQLHLLSDPLSEKAYLEVQGSSNLLMVVFRTQQYFPKSPSMVIIESQFVNLNLQNFSFQIHLPKREGKRYTAGQLAFGESSKEYLKGQDDCRLPNATGIPWEEATAPAGRPAAEGKPFRRSLARWSRT